MVPLQTWIERKLMGLVGDVLELLFGPDDRFQTVRATIRHRRDNVLTLRAISARLPPIGRRKAGTPGDSNPPKVFESTLEIWVKPPACARIVEHREVRGYGETKLTVIDGDHRWERDALGHVETSEIDGRDPTVPRSCPIDLKVDRHFSPAHIRLFLQDMTLESLGLARTAGRDCVRLRAVPRPKSQLSPYRFALGGDEYELHVDSERGALLNIISRVGGEPIEVNEVLQVAFDEPLEASLFTYEPAPGEQVAPKEPGVESMTLTAAAARMPFTILFPTRVPDSEHAKLGVAYTPPSRQFRWPRLTLHYSGISSGSLSVDQSGNPNHGLDNFEWERLAEDDLFQHDLRISDPGNAAAVRMVAFEQQGTHVTIKSSLDRTRLIDFARSFIALDRTRLLELAGSFISSSSARVRGARPPGS